jgi:hypothetical protein
MHSLQAIALIAGAFLLAGCGSSAEWVHPKKSKDSFGQDYNRCEMSVQQDPKVQAGSKAMLYKEIDRCLAREGWLLVEKP